MKTNFLKVGDKIVMKPSTDGLEYELEANKAYNVKYDRFTGDIFFESTPIFSLPSKIYSTQEDDAFISKVLKKYESTESGVLGVMLSGLKGSGKTVTLKQIAIESKLPIVLLSGEIPEYKYKQLFKGLANTDACLVFDEIDKQNSTVVGMGELLQVLDGMNTVGKKLMLFACNDDKKVNEFLIDRCSRVRYWKRFDKMPKEMIEKVVKDRLDNKDEVKVNEVSNFIYNKFKCISFDNILSFVEEVNIFPDENLESLFNDMNLTKKK